MELTKDFNKIEFESKDGSEMTETAFNNIKLVAVNLQKIRDHINKPIVVNSGYRSPQHNKKIGGVTNSYHTKGLAADIVVKGMRTKNLAAIIRKMMKNGCLNKGGVGLYNNFVHVDFRGYLAKWDKSSWYNFI